MLKSDIIKEIRYVVNWLREYGGNVEINEMMERHHLRTLNSLRNRTKAELEEIYMELDGAMVWYQ